MYVCICVCTYTLIRAAVLVEFRDVLLGVWRYVCMYVRMYVYGLHSDGHCEVQRCFPRYCICNHVCIHVIMYVCIYIYIYIYIYI
jgi:hypothetical protein